MYKNWNTYDGGVILFRTLRTKICEHARDRVLLHARAGRTGARECLPNVLDDYGTAPVELQYDNDVVFTRKPNDLNVLNTGTVESVK